MRVEFPFLAGFCLNDKRLLIIPGAVAELP